MPYTFGRNVLLNSVGFDRLIDAFEQMSAGDSGNKAHSYPPYNIVKMSERDYAIELAVAGFKRNEIDITAEGNKLTVTGKYMEVSVLRRSRPKALRTAISSTNSRWRKRWSSIPRISRMDCF